MIDRLAIVFAVLFGALWLLGSGSADTQIMAKLGWLVTAVLWAFLRGISWAVSPRTR